MESKDEIIDVNLLSLEEWLELIFNPPKGVKFKDHDFPTDKHFQEYLNTIDQRSEEEVYRLLHKFLLLSGKLGIDDLRFEILKQAKKDAPEMFKLMISQRYYQRLVLYNMGHSQYPPWEGITWILDLLPHFPKQAIEGLNAYILAHAQELPDSRYSGLNEAVAIIRAKFIGIPGSKSEKLQFLLELHPREFEHLTERLYNAMGYETILTPQQKDGGRDIIASKQSPGELEHLRIECKRYNIPVVLGTVQKLLGVVSNEKVNKGVLVTTSRFTGPAKKFAEQNPRLELIAGDQLILLMNEYLGAKWPIHIDRLINESQKQVVEQKKYPLNTNSGLSG